MPPSKLPVRLGPAEIVDGRPFTDPDRSAEDLASLRYMGVKLHRLLRQPEKIPERPRPLVLQFVEDEIRDHRIVICRLRALLSTRPLTFVGFCGQKRAKADRSLLDDVDKELINEFLEHPHLLSYSSLELPNGDWRNLVLLSHPDGIRHWHQSRRHVYAARKLAPDYYKNVRLHNGVILEGLRSASEPVIIRTKYYDFQDQRPWRAVREFQTLAQRYAT